MRRFLLACAAFGVLPSFGQPVIGASGYSSQLPIPVAPGEVITLFVEGGNVQLTTPVRGSGSPLPASLGGVSVIYRQGSDRPASMLEVRPISSCLGPSQPGGTTCSTILAVTAQLPFEMLTLCPLCGRPDIPAFISVSVNGATSAEYAVQPLDDQVHFLTVCDIAAGAAPRPASALPCAPMATHADGTMVTAASPAQSGEELVAYAVGLGKTGLPQTDGVAPTAPASTQYAFAIDYNYRPNTFATKPLGPSFFGTPTRIYPMPVFTGVTPGFVGLYQVNFVVPPLPANGIDNCANPGTSGPYGNVIQSNLTVSVGSVFSFDGIGICVAAGS